MKPPPLLPLIDAEAKFLLKLENENEVIIFFFFWGPNAFTTRLSSYFVKMIKIELSSFE